MRKTDQVAALIELGAVIETVENTYRPDTAGMLKRVTKVQKASYAAECLNTGDANGWIQGKEFWGALPTRQMDVVAVDHESATFYLDQKLERLAGHTVTIRRTA